MFSVGELEYKTRFLFRREQLTGMCSRKILLLTALVLLTSQAYGISSSIESSCGDNEIELVSINDTEGGHIAEPGYYSENKVCVEGIKQAEIRQSCKTGETHSFSMFELENAHLSMYSVYNYDVCTGRTIGRIADTCDQGSAVLSVMSDNNTHVAKPGYFSKQLCLFKEPPENVTLELSGLSGSFYADGQSISSGETFSIAEYPYIVSEESSHTRGIVSYGDFVRLSRSSAGTISLTQSSGGFLLPFTSGAMEDIENRQQRVNSRRFLNLLSPSFGYAIPDNPMVKIILQPDQKVEGFSNTLKRDIRITVKNKGLEDGELVIELRQG